jgi:hypothetical protein
LTWYAADAKTAIQLNANEAIATVKLADKAAAGSSVSIATDMTDITGAAISSDVAVASLPTEFSLMQNYPNPFNPSTKIEYSLEKAAQVSLKIYNVLGNEVATLVNGRQEAGRYTVPFNTNTGTLSLSSGVYFYRLETGSFVSTKKLILMK